MPSTIAAESAGPYSLAVTVWCTKPSWTAPYAGPERGGTDAAPHSARVMMGAGAVGPGTAWLARAPARRRSRAVTDRATVAAGLARTKRTRRPRAEPRRRNWRRSAEPV